MSSNKDLISVIIPVYNVERYLDRCMESVIKQVYPKVEIILVDDGSTDTSSEICDRWTKRYSDIIRTFHQTNQGASIARKKGIALAKGKYMMFVDSDDFVSPYYVSALYDAVIEANANMALCPMKRVNEGCNASFDNLIKTRVMAKNEFFSRFFQYEFWGFGGGIYRRELFDNLIFPKATINEDYFVKSQLFVGEKLVGYVEEPLYYYEQHQGSLSRQPLSLRALGEFDNAFATWEFIKANLPEYSNQALAIASEVACKWLGELNKCRAAKFAVYERRICRFLAVNLRAIFLCPFLLWKIKLVILYNFVWLKSRQ